MEVTMPDEHAVTVPFSLAVDIFTMLKSINESDQFVAFSRDKGTITILRNRSDSFDQVLATHNIPDAVDVDTLTRFIASLVASGQAAQFAKDTNALLVVPEVTYT